MRLGSWAAALKLAAASRVAARREADGRKSGDWRPFDHADDEVGVALTLTRRSAARLLDLALSLDRLPLTRAALAAGLIGERRAEVITGELAGLDDAHATAAGKLIIAKAPGLTSGQLRALARRLVISAGPSGGTTPGGTTPGGTSPDPGPTGQPPAPGDPDAGSFPAPPAPARDCAGRCT